MSRLPSLLALALAAIGCGKSSSAGTDATAKPDPAALVPVQVPGARCPITIPGDSEIADATDTSFTVKVKGGRPHVDPSIMVVNAITSVFSKTIDPGAANLRFTVEEQRPDGYALEGDFDLQGRKYYFVNRDIPCGPKAWLACRIKTVDPKEASYASRVCRSLVASK